MSDRPKAGMAERRRRKEAIQANRITRREATDRWMRDRKEALAKAMTKAKRKRARTKRSEFGTGRVPAHLRKIPTPESLATLEPSQVGTYRGVSGNRAARRAMGQRGQRISLAKAGRAVHR